MKLSVPNCCGGVKNPYCHPFNLKKNTSSEKIRRILCNLQLPNRIDQELFFDASSLLLSPSESIILKFQLSHPLESKPERIETKSWFLKKY